MKNYLYINPQYTNKNKKLTLKEIIFARACCCLGIVIFHYFCNARGKFKFLYTTANSGWGFMFVTSFFCISGTVFYYNYPIIISKKQFYYKRWKAILLPYYICFIYFYIQFVFHFKSVFYNGHWSRLFFTVFGLDGYFSYKYKTYYIIGEWFLGAIIIIYSIYPFLLWLMNNYFLFSQLLICSIYYFMFKTNFFIISKYRNLITCINSFYFGMSAIKLRKYFFYNKTIFIISFVLLIFLCLYRIKPFFLIHQIQGFCLYIVLVQIGRYIMKNNTNIIFMEISSLSYYIFLFHRRIIRAILSLYNPVDWYYHLLLIGIIIFSAFTCSKILFIFVNSIINSKLFKKLESLFLVNN